MFLTDVLGEAFTLLKLDRKSSKSQNKILPNVISNKIKTFVQTAIALYLANQLEKKLKHVCYLNETVLKPFLFTTDKKSTTNILRG